MKPRKIKPDIYWVGAVDWDRRLFDELIPLPDGTSYNAYLIKGNEKTALIDTVDPTMVNVLINNLEQLDIEIAGEDQIDINNAWQAAVWNINDPGSLGIGDINYWVVKGGVGAVETFTRNGGNSIRARRIGSVSAGN